MRPKELHPANDLSGEIVMPGDKSISHRAIMIGAIARGRTEAAGILDCDDCNFTIDAFRRMGVSIEKQGNVTAIDGVGLKGLKAPKGPLNVGNSGTTMRVLAGILAGQDFEVTLAGDNSLSARPMKRVTEPLSLMGVEISAGPGGLPPVRIKGGRVRPIKYRLPVASAQVKSCVLFAGLYADGMTEVSEPVRSRDHTERMLKYFGADINLGSSGVSVNGGRELTAKSLQVPGDISSASFFMAGASILMGSEILIRGVGINPTRAGILNIMSRMGANIDVISKKDTFEPSGDIIIKGSKTKGVVIEKDEIPAVIDELPVIFVLAALSDGKTVIRGAGELRVKETDRIASMKYNLEKMGAVMNVEKDSIVIGGVRRLKGAGLKSFGDHRTCMAMAVAALAADGPSKIDDVECASKSFPGFFDVFDKIGNR